MSIGTPTAADKATSGVRRSMNSAGFDLLLFLAQPVCRYSERIFARKHLRSCC